LKIANVIDWY